MRSGRPGSRQGGGQEPGLRNSRALFIRREENGLWCSARRGSSCSRASQFLQQDPSPGQLTPKRHQHHSRCSPGASSSSYKIPMHPLPAEKPPGNPSQGAQQFKKTHLHGRCHPAPSQSGPGLAGCPVGRSREQPANDWLGSRSPPCSMLLWAKVGESGLRGGRRGGRGRAGGGGEREKEPRALAVWTGSASLTNGKHDSAGPVAPTGSLGSICQSPQLSAQHLAYVRQCSPSLSGIATPLLSLGSHSRRARRRKCWRACVYRLEIFPENAAKCQGAVGTREGISGRQSEVGPR